MTKRQGITKKTRFEVFKRDSFICQYCGASAPTVVLQVDHIQPVSKDGDNDILNLITSCFDCNAGKKDRLLSDDSVITKQKAQLDELNVRREQLELMLQWRNDLKSIDETAIQAVATEWANLVDGYSLNETGLQSVKQLINKFGLGNVLDAISAAEVYLQREDGKLTQDSVEKAFQKIGGICRVRQQPEWKRELYYIRGIARNRLSYCNQYQLMEWMIAAYENDTDIEDIRNAVLTARNWTSLKNQLFYMMEKPE